MLCGGCVLGFALLFVSSRAERTNRCCVLLWVLQASMVSDTPRWRPYRVECTGSLPTSEVKRRRARLVLGWGTAREDLRVLPAFSIRLVTFTKMLESNSVTLSSTTFSLKSTNTPDRTRNPLVSDSNSSWAIIQSPLMHSAMFCRCPQKRCVSSPNGASSNLDDTTGAIGSHPAP